MYEYDAYEVPNPEMEDIIDTLHNAVTINVSDIRIIATKVHKMLNSLLVSAIVCE